jgi:hypothetical protein
MARPKVVSLSGWGGLVVAFGIAIKGLDWQIDGAIKTAALAFLVAWIVFSFAFYISSAWDKRRPWTMAAQISAAIVLILVWVAYLPPPQISANSALAQRDITTAVEQGIAKSQRVELRAEIHQVLGSSEVYDNTERPSGDETPLYITVGMTVVNSGTVPSTAHGWLGGLKIQDGKILEGFTVGFPSNSETLGFKGPGGKVVKYSIDDLLTTRTIKPIPPGEAVPGILVFRFEQIKKRDFVPPAEFCVRFLDAQSNQYLTCFNIESYATDPRYFMVPGLRPEVQEQGKARHGMR